MVEWLSEAAEKVSHFSSHMAQGNPLASLCSLGQFTQKQTAGQMLIEVTQCIVVFEELNDA